MAGINEGIDENIFNEIPPSKTLTEQTVTVHRGHVLKEMIQEFKDVDSFLKISRRDSC